MPDDARRHWNARYQQGAGATEPSPFLLAATPLLPSTGRALDIAGGRGRHAIWLAQRGFEVTLIDVSDVAVDLAVEAAADAGVALNTVVSDLTRDPLPPGPWDLVLVFHYLDRPIFHRLAQILSPGGVLIAVVATKRNLERHDRPPARYLVDEGELSRLVAPLAIERYEEGWLEEGRHEARVIARRPPLPG